MTPDISIIIPTYKRHTSLERTLKSVAQCRPSSSEVIVVDQSPESKDKSTSICKRYPFLKYICIPLPGLPKARNTGIINSTGSIILFIDDDMIVHPDCFTEHLSTHTQNGIDAVAGRIRQMNDNVSWAQTSTVATIDNQTGETTGNFDLDYDGDVLYATGGHMSIKREVLKNSGLFNPRFIGNALYEDVEFFSRIRKSGYTIRYNANAIVSHYPVNNGGCHNSNSSQYLIERLHNHTLFYILHIKRMPSKAFIIYQKNLIEYISRKKNRRHSIIQFFICIFSIFRAYIDACISYFFIPKLNK